MEKDPVKVLFQPMNREITIERDSTILEAIRRADVSLENVCGGQGECGKCKVIVESGDISLLSDVYKKYLSDKEISEKYQLACQTRLLTDSIITIPIESQIRNPKILSKAQTVLKFEIDKGYRSGDYGLAIDVGTTTIFMYLVDLTTGAILDRASTLNKQITYGEELITRLGYAFTENGSDKLQQKVVESINELIEKLTKRNKIKIGNIKSITAAGNTPMNHFLTKRSTEYLNHADANVSREPILETAGKLGIKANQTATVYCLPNMSRFIGGDVVGDILASGMCNSGEISLLIDLGTNGEIIFGNREWLFSCSVPSGPAYEGMGIKHGMRAMEGAIEHVKIDPKTFEAEYRVIGNCKPRGICGSGVVDVMAEMYATQLLDFAGKINPKSKTPLIKKGDDGLEYVIVPAEETEIAKDIVITQKDIDYAMDSKATVCGGIATLMKKLDLSIKDVKNVYLAGALGKYIDIANAMKIGIFPEFSKAKISQIGNGSVVGAYLTLLSSKERKKAEGIASKMAYVELLTDLDFIEEYEAALFIPGLKRELFPTSYKEIDSSF